MDEKVKTEFLPFPQEHINARAAAKQPKYLLPKPKVTINSNPGAPKPTFDPNTAHMDAAAVKAFQEHLATQKAQQEASQAQQQNVPVVPVPPNNLVKPVSDSEYSSLALPSNFAFYPFKDLYVRPFKVAQLAKMSRAHKEASLLPMVEAVSSVIKTTTPGFENGLAFHLTLPDFYFILYWLRTNCFTKTVYNHKSECRNPQHILDVAEGRKLKESLRISQQIRSTTLNVVNLETMPDLEEFVLSNPDLYLKPCTTLDTVELIENTRLMDKEFQYLSELAVFIQSKTSTLSLDDRVAILSDMDPDDAELIKRYTSLCNDYGVDEKITLKCPGCGASVETKLSIEAHDFLPSA